MNKPSDGGEVRPATAVDSASLSHDTSTAVFFYLTGWQYCSGSGEASGYFIRWLSNCVKAQHLLDDLQQLIILLVKHSSMLGCCNGQVVRSYLSNFFMHSYNIRISNVGQDNPDNYSVSVHEAKNGGHSCEDNLCATKQEVAKVLAELAESFDSTIFDE